MEAWIIKIRFDIGFADNKDIKRCDTGYAVYVNSKSNLAKSCLQKMVSLQSCEAEYKLKLMEAMKNSSFGSQLRVWKLLLYIICFYVLVVSGQCSLV